MAGFYKPDAPRPITQPIVSNYQSSEANSKHWLQLSWLLDFQPLMEGVLFPLCWLSSAGTFCVNSSGIYSVWLHYQSVAVLLRVISGFSVAYYNTVCGKWYCGMKYAAVLSVFCWYDLSSSSHQLLSQHVWRCYSAVLSLHQQPFKHDDFLWHHIGHPMFACHLHKPFTIIITNC